VTLGRIGCLLAVLAAVILQVTVLNRVGLPGGAPNLVVAVVVVIGLATGPARGAGAGFIAGFLADCLSTHPLGRLALILALIGYGAGLLHGAEHRSRLVGVLAVGGGAAAMVLGYATLAVLASDTDVTVGAVFRDLLGVTFWTLLLAPLVMAAAAPFSRLPSFGGRAWAGDLR
jgi:rod shape-determining protein MreD